jgi:hypothetical protein
MATQSSELSKALEKVETYLEVYGAVDGRLECFPQGIRNLHQNILQVVCSEHSLIIGHDTGSDELVEQSDVLFPKLCLQRSVGEMRPKVYLAILGLRFCIWNRGKQSQDASVDIDFQCPSSDTVYPEVKLEEHREICAMKFGGIPNLVTLQSATLWSTLQRDFVWVK